MKKRYAQKNKILLVNITRLGDMLQATPTIAGMKAENPDCHITVLVEKQFSDVCNYLPHIDELVSIDLSMVVRSLAREQEGIVDAYEYLSEVVENLQQQKFDYCLNMSSSAYTAILLNMIGIKRNGGWTADDEGYRRIESDWAKLFATSVFHQNRQYNSLNLVDVFRCSADVEDHPQKLQITVPPDATVYAKEFIAQAGFTNNGPLIAIQAGASQGKRQWAPEKFVRLVKGLIDHLQARVILTGTEKELPILDPIRTGVNSPNVVIAAGKTSIPQLAAMVQESQLLITGDTGTMHISVAAGTPVIALFLASAYGYETGPYGEGNIILQPVIGCGPCNPNKPCARPDCHDTIEPELLVRLAEERLRGDIRILPDELVDPNKVIIYRSTFDELGFYDLQYMHPSYRDSLKPYRDAYRKLWLNDIGGYEMSSSPDTSPKPSLRVVSDAIPGLSEIVQMADTGVALIRELVRLIEDPRSTGQELGDINSAIADLDRKIEDIGFFQAPLGPLTRMFLFAKENLSGTDALSLASEMGRIYADLSRRTKKFASFYQESSQIAEKTVRSSIRYQNDRREAGYL